MYRISTLFVGAVIVLAAAATLTAKDKAKPAAIIATDSAHAGPDFEVQGEYVGEVPGTGGTDKLGRRRSAEKIGAQIIALGDGRFHAVAYTGGLPGDGWNGKPDQVFDGQTKDSVTTFNTKDQLTVTIRAGLITVKAPNGETMFTLNKTVRKSPTLGAEPPAGAIVLFDGKSADAFDNGRVKDGLLLEGATSKQKFRNYKIHLEFMLPFMPDARGQAHGNSGYYAQSRYETQILDSFGLAPQNDDCGAIYKIKPPRINMCYPPLSWQTYNVDFTAAQYKDGKKVKNARLTVLHNGVEVQKDTEATHATTAAPLHEGPGPAPIYLQDHGNPVRFRNIWVVEKK